MNRHQRRKRSLILKARYQLADNERKQREEREAIVKANRQNPESEADRIWRRQVRSSYSQFASATPQGASAGPRKLFNPKDSRGEKPRFEGR